MKVIITGVAGFIGSNLAGRFLSEGHEVFGVDDFSYGFERNISLLRDFTKFTFKQGNLTDHVLEGVSADVLIHLASQKIPRYSSAMKTLQDNSQMLSIVLNKCVSEKIQLLFASTSDIYGKNPETPYHEESDIVLGPTTVRRWSYALSKIYGEQLIQAYHQDLGLTYTIMRFFGSYGPNQNLTWWGGPQSVFIQNIIDNKPLEIHGDGKQTRTFTYVEDTVDGIYRCAVNVKARNEIFNIAGNPTEEISISGLANLISDIMIERGKRPEIKFIPYETFGKYEDVRKRLPSIQKIKEMLGFNPAFDLKSGLKKTIEWQMKIQ